jgi:hypothetical protein
MTLTLLNLAEKDSPSVRRRTELFVMFDTTAAAGGFANAPQTHRLRMIHQKRVYDDVFEILPGQETSYLLSASSG